MAGLVGYESSDEEDAVEQPTSPPQAKASQPQAPSASSNQQPKPDDRVSAPAPVTAPAPGPVVGPQLGPQTQVTPSQASASAPTAAAVAPSAGAAPPLAFPPLEEAPEDDDDDDTAGEGPPGSPYTSARAAVHSLTLPTVPNTDLLGPASPPRSPSSRDREDTLTRKFARFIDLKRQQGVHFNARLADSAAARNPALADKLLSFVGVGGSASGSAEGENSSSADAYATSLPPDLAAGLWDPAAFGRHAFREQLRAAQVEGAGARARPKGGAVEFVSAGASDPGAGAGTTGAGGASKRKTRFDT